MIERPEPSDPRDDHAPLLETVGLLTVSAVAITLLTRLLGAQDGDGAGSLRLLLLGPVALVFFEVMVHEIWWRRWWGALPGAVVGLAVYFEGRTALEDVIGASWAASLAYVLAWAGFGVIFALASRVPMGRHVPNS
ncbi:hypothetical protein ACIBCT_34655 [Streptosporangium sp. NPDC050855]|uniref:hypothetical protein n=1 Tax=Streptosporangium sp. NPDC050855 TaxID=3366194 RepID=UPI0037B808AC